MLLTDRLTDEERRGGKQGADEDDLGVTLRRKLSQQVDVEDGEAVGDAVDNAVYEERRQHDRKSTATTLRLIIRHLHTQLKILLVLSRS